MIHALLIWKNSSSFFKRSLLLLRINILLFWYKIKIIVAEISIETGKPELNAISKKILWECCIPSNFPSDKLYKSEKDPPPYPVNKLAFISFKDLVHISTLGNEFILLRDAKEVLSNNDDGINLKIESWILKEKKGIKFVKTIPVPKNNEIISNLNFFIGVNKINAKTIETNAFLEVVRIII